MCFRENFGYITAVELQAILSYLNEESCPYEKALEFLKTIDEAQLTKENNYVVELEKAWDKLLDTPGLASLLKKKNIESHYELIIKAIEHYEEYD